MNNQCSNIASNISFKCRELPPAYDSDFLNQFVVLHSSSEIILRFPLDLQIEFNLEHIKTTYKDAVMRYERDKPYKELILTKHTI